MAESKVGFILALIGGILGILLGIMMAAGSALVTKIPTVKVTESPTVLIVWGIMYIVFSVLMLIGGLWMRDAKTCKKGGLFALIFGVLGGLNILGIIGGILGIVAGAKK